MCKFLIAGHYLIIKTTNAEATDALLPTFRPFRLEQEEGKKDWQQEDKNVLFCFPGTRLFLFRAMNRMRHSQWTVLRLLCITATGKLP